MNVKVMNIRKLALTCSAIALSAGLGSAIADEAVSDYAVAYVPDAAYGKLMRAGDYESVISRLEGEARSGLDGFFAATNLCIAYLKTDRLEQARTTCDDAVSLIVDEIEVGPGADGDSAAAQANRGLLAQALSNRGVAYAMSGQPELARTDFCAALIARASIREAETNLALLEDRHPSAF